MGRSPDRNVKKINLKHALDLDRRGLLNRQFNLPPGKDTIAVPNNGYVVFRFRADNPGRWMHDSVFWHQAEETKSLLDVTRDKQFLTLPKYYYCEQMK